MECQWNQQQMIQFNLHASMLHKLVISLLLYRFLQIHANVGSVVIVVVMVLGNKLQHSAR